MIFPCTGCGCCCKRIGMVKPFLTLEEFPYNTNNDGVCEMLIDDKCSVYNERPDICRIDKMATKSNIDTAEYYKLAIHVCNNFMDEDNIPLNFRINGIQ
jgi:Fe-S-cluster containining protein